MKLLKTLITAAILLFSKPASSQPEIDISASSEFIAQVPVNVKRIDSSTINADLYFSVQGSIEKDNIGAKFYVVGRNDQSNDVLWDVYQEKESDKYGMEYGMTEWFNKPKSIGVLLEAKGFHGGIELADNYLDERLLNNDAFWFRSDSSQAVFDSLETVPRPRYYRNELLDEWLDLIRSVVGDVYEYNLKETYSTHTEKAHFFFGYTRKIPYLKASATSFISTEKKVHKLTDNILQNTTYLGERIYDDQGLQFYLRPELDIIDLYVSGLYAERQTTKKATRFGNIFIAAPPTNWLQYHLELYGNTLIKNYGRCFGAKFTVFSAPSKENHRKRLIAWKETQDLIQTSNFTNITHLTTSLFEHEFLNPLTGTSASVEIRRREKDEKPTKVICYLSNHNGGGGTVVYNLTDKNGLIAYTNHSFLFGISWDEEQHWGIHAGASFSFNHNKSKKSSFSRKIKNRKNTI